MSQSLVAAFHQLPEQTGRKLTLDQVQGCGNPGVGLWLGQWHCTRWPRWLAPFPSQQMVALREENSSLKDVVEVRIWHHLLLEKGAHVFESINRHFTDDANKRGSRLTKRTSSPPHRDTSGHKCQVWQSAAPAAADAGGDRQSTTDDGATAQGHFLYAWIPLCWWWKTVVVSLWGVIVLLTRSLTHSLTRSLAHRSWWRSWKSRRGGDKNDRRCEDRSIEMRTAQKTDSVFVTSAFRHRDDVLQERSTFVKTYFRCLLMS